SDVLEIDEDGKRVGRLWQWSLLNPQERSYPRRVFSLQFRQQVLRRFGRLGRWILLNQFLKFLPVFRRPIAILLAKIELVLRRHFLFFGLQGRRVLLGFVLALRVAGACDGGRSVGYSDFL